MKTTIKHNGKELIKAIEVAVKYTKKALAGSGEDKELQAAFDYVKALYAQSVKRPRWIPVTEALPDCDRRPNSFGRPVLVHPIPFKGENGYAEIPAAFYGCRVTDKPSFYVFGKVVEVTHWMPFPEPPGPL